MAALEELGVIVMVSNPNVANIMNHHYQFKFFPHNPCRNLSQALEYLNN